MRNEKVAGARCFGEFSEMLRPGAKNVVLNLFVLKCLRLKSMVLHVFLQRLIAFN